MKQVNLNEKSRMGWRVCALVVAMGACLLMSGCETFRMWGAKGSSVPGQVGGGVSIPFGGGKK